MQLTLQPYKQIQGTYVHIPFCRQKCLYCDFNSYAGFGADVMAAYAAAVCREIAGRKSKLPVNENASIYFGGGTPSLLPLEQTAQIVSALKKYGYWQKPREASIEANPGTVDLEKLQALRQMGFDRISFGVQSLNDAELKTIGRVHNAAEALEAIELAKQAGFKRINADVIYALPGQTLASLQNTLEQLVATGIEHLSVYGLIVEDGTPLQKLVDAGKIILPDEDESADMYEFVQEFLAVQGFERYEISNYARGGAYSRHNLVYWHYYSYAAFGAGACGFFVGILSPGAMSAAGRGLPAAGGWMLASLAVSQDVGAALLPSAGSALAENFSVRACFLVLSAAPLLAAVFLALMAGTGGKKRGLPLTFQENSSKHRGNDRQ